MSARSLDRRVLILLAICAVLVVTYSIIRGATGTSDFKNPYRVARIFWETVSKLFCKKASTRRRVLLRA